MKKLIIAATALLAGTALAQTAPVTPEAPAPTARPVVAKTFTRAETVALVREHFGRMDADRNGSITKEEAMAGHARMAEHRKGMRGMHGEGGAPHMAMPARDPNVAFDRIDANKDGSISRDEFGNAREQRIERRIVRQGEDGAKDGKDPRRVMRMHRRGGGFGARMIVMADTNSDGQITLGEAEALALQHFDQMDSNKDGQVTPEERRAGRPMIIKRMREEKKTAG